MSIGDYVTGVACSRPLNASPADRGARALNHMPITVRSVFERCGFARVAPTAGSVAMLMSEAVR